MEQFANGSRSTLVADIDASAVTLTVASAASFPTTGTFRIIVGTELMVVTSVAGAVFTVTRGAESSVAASHSSGVNVTGVVTAGAINQLKDDVVSSLGRVTSLDSNHIHAWELGDASGNFVDTGSSSSKVNLTANSTPLYASEGMLGPCARFGMSATGTSAASSASALISAFSDLPASTLTLEAWVQCDNSGYGAVLGCDNVGSSNFFISNSSGSTGLTITTNANSFKSTATPLSGFRCPPVMTWHYIVATYDGSNVYLYVNGDVVATHTNTGSITWTTGTTPKFWVAGTQNSAGQFIGHVSRVRMSNIARSQSYIKSVVRKAMVW